MTKTAIGASWVLTSLLATATAFGASAPSKPSGADALLQAVQGSAPAEAAATSAAPSPFEAMGDLKPSNALELQLFSEWRVEKALPYEVNAWIMKILRQQHADAAHLWTIIEPKLPSTFRTTATIAQTYLYWKLDLPQTFFDEWLNRTSEPEYAASRMSAALEQTVGTGFDDWMQARQPTVSAEQATRIRAFEPNRGTMHLTTVAYVARRSGEAAIPILNLLPIGHRFRIELAQTAALALARKGDLAGAGKILKAQLEPEIERLKNPKLLANHYLQVARLLYQAGALEAAESYYERVPNSTPDYLSAREELTWIWLRSGDTQKLRGSLETLGSRLFDGKFTPEVHLVRAISNLKLCYYDQVERDFKRFQDSNRPWAKRISDALAVSETPVPENIDLRSLQAQMAIQSREAEAKRLATLGEQSVGASLPAVGPQLHWKRASDRLAVHLEDARKARAQEFRRQWTAQRLALTEAIRKMQFVKVEMLSQTQLAGYGAQDTISVSAAAPQRSKPSERIRKSDQEIGFAFDGVIWPDELFRLRALAPGRCAGQQN